LVVLNNKGEYTMEDLIINTIDGDNALIERKFQFHANDTDYILDPKKDITPYELWNVFKFIEDIKLNAHCSNYGNILHNQSQLPGTKHPAC